MRRIVSVWLIDWPVAVWSRAAGRTPPPDGVPFALVERGPHGLTLRALNRAARAAGLRRDQRHADARAIVPHLVSAAAEPQEEARVLAELGGWCTRWTPLVALDCSAGGYEGLFLDITGGAHLFGGEAALLRDVRRRLARMGARSRVAVADTPGAAWAMARFGGVAEAVVPPGGQREELAGLSTAALRVDADTIKRAHRFGLKTIGSLLAMPRQGLARRFRDGDALGLVTRLDQAMGITPEPLEFQQPPPRYLARRVYAEPLLHADQIQAGLEPLCAVLAAQLYDDAMGARALTLAAFRTDGRVETLAVRLGLASRDTMVWRRLFRETGIDRIDPGFGIDALALAADLAEPLAPRQAGFEEEAQGEALSGLVDRLAARLGERAVRRAEPFASWLPERSVRWALAQQSRSALKEFLERERPILLLEPEPIETTFVAPEGAPVRFKWRRALRRVVRIQGPERLSPEWWRPARNAHRTRDYYRVEDEQGARYWLYREGLRDWEDSENPPSWWMHGLFP